jgi:hypothetical protein
VVDVPPWRRRNGAQEPFEFIDEGGDASIGLLPLERMVDQRRGVGERVRSVLVETTLAPGSAHVFGAGSSAELARAYAKGARADRIYVHATLVAVLDSGRLISTECPDVGCSVQRVVGKELSSSDDALTRGEREIESHVRTMLGLGEHRPPHFAWDRLIESLAGNGITVSGDALMTLPLAIELSQSLRNELCRDDDESCRPS